MTREQMHAELLEAIHRAPHIGLSLASISAYDKMTPEEQLTALQEYGARLLRELNAVSQKIAELRLAKGDA